MSEPTDQDEPREDEPREDLPDLGRSAAGQPLTLNYQRYRTLVHMAEIGPAGQWIEIDVDDPAWEQLIDENWIVAEADWQGPDEPVE